MEHKTNPDPGLAAAAERYFQFLRDIQNRTATAEIDRKSTVPSVKARAQRALASVRLKQATPVNDLATANKQLVMTLDESRRPIEDGLAALLDVTLALIARDTEADAVQDRRAAKSNTATDLGIPIEARRFVEAMLARGVSRSMFDVFTKEELDVHAQLFWEKTDDYRHMVGEGAWVALFRGGYIDFPVAGLTDDEALAARLARGGDTEEGLVAKEFLEEMARRPLTISPSLALALVRDHRAKEKARGLRLTVERIEVDDVDKDVGCLMLLLGLGDDDRDRAADIWRRVYVRETQKFDQQRAAERAAQREREDEYMDLAREVRQHRTDRNAAWSAASRERQAAQRTVDDSEPDSAQSHYGDRRGPSIDADLVEEGLDPAIQVERAFHETAMEAARQTAREAMARIEEFELRELAGQIAAREGQRSWLRRQGFEVPEPRVAGHDQTPNVRATSIHVSSPENHADPPGPANERPTRAERARMMKVRT